MSLENKLYSIEDIKFDIKNFIDLGKTIKEKFATYNKHMEFCPFDTQFLIMQLLKYEARNSNMIEGIYVNDIDILSNDISGSKKITNYLSSLKLAIEDYNKEQIIKNDTLKKIHKKLYDNMISADAINATPGQWRVKNAKIAKHTPPNPVYIESYINEFINWVNNKDFLSDYPLELRCPIKVAIAHAYFEKIHPFSDGNGRVGRILINLIINTFKITKETNFFISKSILENQFEYYVQLEKLDNNTDWNNWIKFFLNLVIEQLDTNISLIKNSLNLLIEIKNDLLKEEDSFNRILKNNILKYISRYPIFTYEKLEKYILQTQENIDKDNLKNIFNDLVNKYEIKKIKGTSFMEFTKVLKIIV
ncbi:Fic family protein [Spiroplasma litorale]|uniref:Fic family protein n=1 Tax=Spiroplasma litorale TaxID=216942 RepID=A0A0K1W2H4_9MOLU|nr:Fic family protein [Spiroplasma litorale]AKX34534.1 Fic family protein [Spiroplasma litorale]